MEVILNEAVVAMVNDGNISIDRMDELIYIKDFIDRISTEKYLKEEDVSNLKNKFGVLPTVLTWGDYFQTEMATSFLGKSDDEFFMASSTLRFDMIAAFEVFSGKGSGFLDWVDSIHEEIVSEKDSGYSPEEEEILHLKILKSYFFDLGVSDNFTQSELDWFIDFREAAAM